VWLADPKRGPPVGVEQFTAWLRGRSVHTASALARTALAAADQQTIRLPAEDLTAEIVAELARQVLDLDQRIDDLDEVLTARLGRHPQASILTSLPGIGVLLAAEFLWPLGGDGDASARPESSAELVESLGRCRPEPEGVDGEDGVEGTTERGRQLID